MATDHVAFYKQQISLTEWLENMGHAEATAMRAEDNDKRERLKVLNRACGLPYDEPHQFTARQVTEAGPEFQQFLAEHGEELCAIRLIPTEPTLPKLRMRGQSIKDALKWYADQDIDPAKYRVDFVPHPSVDNWATIFVVNEQGIFGEILQGAHNKLTQGLYDDNEQPVAFSYDFSRWTLNPSSPEAEAYLKEMTSRLIVKDPEVQARLHDELESKFSHNYLAGYFETTDSPDFGTFFIDYNRILGDMYQSFVEPKAKPTAAAIVSGQVGSPGKATGKVRIVLPDELGTAKLQPGEILVCRMTTPDYLPLMQQSAAIVTDLGGILSHAAIVARELGKPCLTATREATAKLKNGQVVEVDAEAGVVREAAA